MKERFSDSELAQFAEARKRSDIDFQLALEVCDEVAEILNELHNSNFSSSFWRMLLLPHVRQCQLSLNQKRSPANIKAGRSRRFFPSLSTALHGAKMLSEFARYPTFRETLVNNNRLIWGFPGHVQPSGVQVPIARPIVRMRGPRRLTLQLAARAKSTAGLLSADVLATLPSSLVSQFPSWYGAIPVENPKAKSFHVCLAGNEFMRMTLAVYWENGSAIHRYQHGSHYGEQHNMERSERECGDFFHTWGWKIHPKDRPDLAYRLEGFKRKFDRCLNSITEDYDLLICLPALAPQIFDRERRNIRSLLLNIDRTKYPRILVRPRPVSRLKLDHRLTSVLQQFDVEIDRDTRPIYESMARAAAVVHMASPSTTFLEALYIKKPVMALLVNPRPSDIVLSHYEFLLGASVYHKSVESLSDALNGYDVKNWFRRISGLQEFHSFRHTFLRSV